jgi:hypothetical protein
MPTMWKENRNRSDRDCVYDNGWKWKTSKPSDFCCGDGDCGVKNNIIGKCCSPGGSGCLGGPYDYTCKWHPCKKNEDCVDNYYSANQGKCVSQGIYSNNPKWLCDPPNGWASNKMEPGTKTQNIFDLIFTFFSHFFQR